MLGTVFTSISVIAAAFLFAALPAVLGQGDSTGLDISKVPMRATSIAGFVPPGWKIEQQISADLNGDSYQDHLLEIMEDKPANKDGTTVDRSRALVIVVQDKDGKLSRAAIADKLLQCTSCGGALYGFVDAPANVKVENGVIIVDQDHGSREVSGTTFRFRYEPATAKFLLIGFDYHSGDRATGDAASESTNYITGARITTQGGGKGKKASTTKSQVPKAKAYIDQVDYEKYEDEASARVDG